MLLLIVVAVLIVGCMLIESVYRPRNSTRLRTRFLAWLRDWRDALRVSQRETLLTTKSRWRAPKGVRDISTAAG